ncbi:MAG: hypothetical protein ABIA59_02120 [Candidatus Latescibacterota bacterium]
MRRAIERVLRSAVPVFAAIVILVGVCEHGLCQWPDGGGFGGRSGMGGMGGGKTPMEEICEKNPDLCQVMEEMRSFCEKDKEYCNMADLKAPAGATGGPGSYGGGGGGGTPGGMGGSGRPRDGGRSAGSTGGQMNDMRRMMMSCMNGGEECKKLIDGMRGQLEYARGIKELCENKDEEACGLIKEEKAFCGENRDLCGWKDPGGANGNNATAQVGPTANGSAYQFREMVSVCRTGADVDKDKCDELKVGARERIGLLQELKEVCAGDAEECEQMKEMVSTCDFNPEKCAQMKEMMALCRENPEECRQMKSRELESEIEGMKARCMESPDVCRRNTEQKRGYCKKYPEDCDEETLILLDEIEEFIAGM